MEPALPVASEATFDTPLFEALLAGAPVGAALLDREGRYLWVNAALTRMNGLPPDAHVGRTPRELIPTIGDTAERLLHAVLAGRGPQTPVELSTAASSGPGIARVWRQIWYPLRRGGQVAAVAVLVWEVTEERSAELAREASSQRLDLALDAGGMGTWDWDLRHDRIRWDQRAAAIFGHDADGFAERLEAFLGMVHPDDRTRLRRAIEEALAERGELRREYRVVRADGDVRWVSVRGRVLTHADGQPDAMVGVMQDRTDIHTTSEQLARTLDTIDEAFFSLDRRWRFTFVNALAEQLLQRPREGLLGEVVWEHFPAAVGTPFQDHYEHVMRAGEARTFEAHYPTLDLWVEVRAYPDPAGIAVYFRDIGERKRREQEQQARVARQAEAHEAARKLLDLPSRLPPDGSPAAIARSVCEAATSVFGCTRASIYQIDGEVVSLLAQSGGRPLPRGTAAPIDGFVGLREALRSRAQPVFYADAQAVASAFERDIARMAGVHSFVQAPITLAGDLGTLLFALSWDRIIAPLGHEMLDVVGRYAQQGALAVEQARRRSAQAEAEQLSAQLQANLLPTPALRTASLSVASRYQPGEHRMLLGGDFYDVVEHDDGGLSLVIGDVTGHGPAAAAIGAALRAGWRTLAMVGTAPGQMVGALDALLRSERSTDEQLVSVCCARLSPDLRTLTLASAGHPPPLLSTADGMQLLESPEGLLLGLPVPAGDWTAMTVALPARWALLLYTDGLPEARRAQGSSERLGLESFAQHLARLDPLGAADLGAVLDRLQDEVRARAGLPVEDDVALLLLRPTGAVAPAAGRERG